MFKYFSLWLLVVLLISACSGSSSTTSGLSIPDEFIGTWQTECALSDPNDTTSVYQIITDTISEDSIVSVYAYYLSSDCTSPATPTQKVLTVEPAFSGGRANTSLGSAYEVDLKLLSREIDGQSENAGVGTNIYSLMLLLDNALYYGANSTEFNGMSPAERHSSLDTQSPYVRN